MSRRGSGWGVVAALIIGVLLMFLVGWFSFSSNQRRATLTVETEQIRDDAQRAVDATAKVIDEVKEETRQALAEPD
ncbi:MAG: hypothetical protein KDA71_17835 [Planctomycetales bacterium]|nr:hypothetical protein [Planctomycetales bacterium]